MVFNYFLRDDKRSGKKIHMYWFIDNRGKRVQKTCKNPDGQRTCGKSTGCINKSSARQYCENLLKSGKLYDGSAKKFVDFATGFFAVAVQMPTYTDYTEISFLLTDGLLEKMPIQFSNTIDCSGSVLVCFKIQFLPGKILSRLSSLLAFTSYANMRKETRYFVDADPLKASLSTENKLLWQNKWLHCLFIDLSFSGTRLFVGNCPGILIGERVAVKIDFINPKQDFVLLAVVVRKKDIEQDITEVALRFEEPIPMNFIERLYHIVK